MRVKFLAGAFVGAVIALAFIWIQTGAGDFLKRAIGPVGEPQQMPEALKNVVGTPAVMHGGQDAFFGRGVEELAEESFFAFKVALMLDHRLCGLDVVCDEFEEVQELFLLRDDLRRFDGEVSVMHGGLQEGEDAVEVVEPGGGVEVLGRGVEQIHGALEIRIAPGHVDGAVEIEGGCVHVGRLIAERRRAMQCGFCRLALRGVLPYMFARIY